jgi:hypothetical protein
MSTDLRTNFFPGVDAGMDSCSDVIECEYYIIKMHSVQSNHMKIGQSTCVVGENVSKHSINKNGYATCKHGLINVSV